MKRRLKAIFELREFMLLAVIVVGCAVMTMASPHFLTFNNLMAVLRGLAVEAIIAVGMTILMVSGSFDLSVGSVLAFSGILTASQLKAGMAVLPAVLLGLLSGVVFGLINGWIVARVRINPFVTTLGMMSVVRGLVLVISGGRGISGLPAAFTQLGRAEWLGIQSTVWVMIALVVLGDILLRRSRFFRQNYYIGGNEKAAILSGIPVERVKIINFTLVSTLAALAGILLTARLGTASVTAGTGMELRIIAAVVIGGASLGGGEGTVTGAFLGTLLMTLITNALNLLGVDVYWQTLVVGATLLAAVVIDSLGNERRKRHMFRILPPEEETAADYPPSGERAVRG